MTNADRELLEMAAKAAGYDVKWNEWVISRDGAFKSIQHEKRKGMMISGKVWNPLVDDGDALRLAVKLGIRISQQLSYCATFCQHGNKSTLGMTWTEQYGADPNAATRRAIVRAAAAMGATAGTA